MLDWIAQFFDRILSVIPRLILVKAYECGIKFGRKGKVTRLDPGLHLHWPMMTEVDTYPTARTTKNMTMQTLTTKNANTCVVSAALVYEMTDPVKAYTENYDIDDTITDLALTAVAEVVSGAFDTELSELESKLTKLTRSRLRPFGVRVERCSLTDAALCRVFRNVCDVPEGESNA